MRPLEVTGGSSPMPFSLSPIGWFRMDVKVDPASEDSPSVPSLCCRDGLDGAAEGTT